MSRVEGEAVHILVLGVRGVGRMGLGWRAGHDSLLEGLQRRSSRSWTGRGKLDHPDHPGKQPGPRHAGLAHGAV